MDKASHLFLISHLWQEELFGAMPKLFFSMPNVTPGIEHSVGGWWSSDVAVARVSLAEFSSKLNPAVCVESVTHTILFISLHSH